MDITRETVNQWLEDNRRSQIWLAEKCSLSKQAVSNWLRDKNPVPISSSAQIIIRRLMEEDAAKTQSKAPQNLVLEFAQADFDNICKAAAALGQVPREWAQFQLADIAALDVEALAAKLKRQKGNGTNG